MESCIANDFDLSTMSFEELQKLRDRVGIKVYNEAILGNLKKLSTKQDSAGTSMADKVFKRANKNRPSEISAKKPVSRFREVIPVKKKVYRDPRFDDLSGEFSEDIFNKSYSFLHDVKQREKLKILKIVQKEKDTERKEQLKRLVKQMEQEERTTQERLAAKEKEREAKKKEKELVKQGKKPFFLKRSEKKKLLLAERYKQLRASGKLEKYLQKKNKRNASKDSHLLPARHQRS